MADNRLKVLNSHLKKCRPLGVLTSGAALSESFRYTVPGSKLTDSDREFYETNGYFVVKGLIGAHDLNKYRERFLEICLGKDSLPGLQVIKDVALAKKFGNVIRGQEDVTKIQNFQYDDTLFGYCSHPEVLDYVEAFCGRNVSAMHTMLINKPPDPGSKTSRHPLHQDLHYFSFRPADRIVCAWTAMERVTKQNGCLVVAPGSHRRGELLKHGYPQWEGGVNRLYFGIEDYKEYEKDRIHLEMEAGDTVFFHPLLVHGSGTNKTNGFRKAISCHYASSDCHHVDASKTGQEGIEKEIASLVQGIAKDKSLQTSLQKTWEILERPVRGKFV